MGREDSFRALLHGILLLMNFFAFDAPAGRKLKPPVANRAPSVKCDRALPKS
jgi:hypothetical protein